MATGLENLKIYQLSVMLEMKVHELTERFPLEEKYRSVDQLRRSSSSVTNNIAESYGKRSLKEQVHILNDVVKGEAQETKSGLLMTLKKGYHADDQIAEQYTGLLKAVSGYIRFLKTKKLNN